MSIRVFALVVTFCMGAGAAIGAGLMRDLQKSAPPPDPSPACIIRADGYNFALVNDDVFPSVVGRFSNLDTAIDASRKLGCAAKP